MIVFVLIVNVLLSLVCFYITWKLWRIRRSLARTANTLTAVERSVYRRLHNAPNGIVRGARGTRRLRQRYQQLERRFAQVQQAIALLGVGVRFWRRRFSGVRR